MTLDVRGLSKTFRSDQRLVDALRAVSFVARRGESVALVGRNGAGKSTLLQAIAGVVTPSAGTIRRPARIASILELGTGLHPDLTGAENLQASLALTRLLSRTDPDPAEIVAFAELDDDMHRPVKHYSDGMKARLSCSIALHARPDLLLMDEVLAVGDAGFQRRVLDRATELVNSGTILLVATHSVELARWAQRCLWLDRGELVRDGDSGPILDEYEITSSIPRRRAVHPAVRIEAVTLEPPSIGTGEGLRVVAVLAASRPTSDLSVRVDLHPVVGEEVWMRPENESPEQRNLNLLATTPDRELGPLEPGSYEVTARIAAVPITSSELELSLVVSGAQGEVHDEVSHPLAVRGLPGRPRVEMVMLAGGTDR